METNNEQIKLLFEKNKNNIDKYFLSKLFSDILCVILVGCLLFLPFFTLGGFKDFSRRYSLELTSSERLELKSLFSEHERNYKKELKEFEDEYGSDYSNLLDDDLVFGSNQIIFWLSVEMLVGEELSDRQRNELVRCYKSTLDFGSLYNMYVFNFPEQLVSIINIIFGGLTVAMVIIIIVNYYKNRSYDKKHSLFMEIYSNSGYVPSASSIITDIIWISLVAGGLCFMVSESLDIGVNLLIFLPIVIFVIYYTIENIMNNYLKDIETEVKIMKAIKEVQTHKI